MNLCPASRLNPSSISASTISHSGAHKRNSLTWLSRHMLECSLGKRLNENPNNSTFSIRNDHCEANSMTSNEDVDDSCDYTLSELS